MKMMTIEIFLLISTFIMTVNGKHKHKVHDTTKCDLADPRVSNCILGGILSLKPSLIDGVPSIHLPPMDPFVIDYIPFDSSTALNMISLKGYLYKVMADGFSEFEITNFKFNRHENEATLELFVPKLKISGSYTSAGSKILFISYTTTGTFDGHLTDVHATLSIRGRIYANPDGKRMYHYLEVTSIQSTVTFDYKHSAINIDPDDSKLFTTYWSFVLNRVPVQTLVSIVNPSIDTEFADSLKYYVNQVAQLLPVEELFES